MSILAATVLAIAQQPAITTPEALQDQLREIVRPLEGPDDLGALYERIGEARFVLLGEASHGTHEFYTWRAAISRHLIEHKSFRFVAVEGDWGACERVNRYVRGEDGAGDSARDVLMTIDRWPRWLWANEEMIELVEWMREHNAELPADQRVGFHGIDVYGVAESLEKAPRYAAKLDDDLAEQVREAFTCFQPHVDDVQGYLRNYAQSRTHCGEQLQGVVETLRENADRWAADDGPTADAFFHAKQNALVVKRAERHYRAMLRQGTPDSWNYRAGHFADTVERLAKRYGEDSRGIVWAHNTHVGDARATPLGMQGMNNIGRLMRQSHDDGKVFIVGFSTHRGTVIAAGAWEQPQQRMTVPRAMAGSFDAMLHDLEIPQFLLLMNEAGDIGGFDRPLAQRAIGVTYNPHQERGNYVPSIIPQRYDALIYIEETKALTPLHE